MNGKTHAGMAAVTYVAICDKFPCKFSLTSIFVLLLASMLPDIDHPKSIINKYILIFKNKNSKTVFYFCAGIVVLWYDLLTLNSPLLCAIGISLIAVGISNHRNGFSHSITGMIIFSFIAGYIGNKLNNITVVYWFMVGYGLHLFCDMATNRGISLFYPFISKKFKFPITYSMSSKSGKLFESLLMAAGLIYIIIRLPHLKF
jgi:inner membrane protein